MSRKNDCPRCQGAGSVTKPGPRRRKNGLAQIMDCPACGCTGKKAIPEEGTDGPVYNAGRWEGRADVCAELRAILDPDDSQHWNIDGLLDEVRRLARALAKSKNGGGTQEMKPIFANWNPTKGPMGQRCEPKVPHCPEDDPAKQEQCTGYMPRPEATPGDPHHAYCWFNYDAEDRITDLCHRPGILVRVTK